MFAREVLGIEPNPAQLRWFSLIRLGGGWSWLSKFILHVAANQVGKTLGLAVIVLWASWYKIGIPTDLTGDPVVDERKWFESPYQWFHVAPKQAQAYLTFRDALLLLKGAHPAQRGPVRLPRSIDGIPAWEETTIETYYKGLTFWHGAVIQFRTTEDKAKALQGVRANGVSMDECAFEDHLVSVVNETLLMRLISTGGPFIGVSTPNGINDWFEMVQDVVDHAEEREPVVDSPLLGGSAKPGEPLPIWEGENGHTLLWSTVEDNIGFGFTREEVDRMEADLDEATKEQQLRGAFLEPTDAFFVPSANVLKCFKDLPASVLPEKGHRYVASWDPSTAADPTAAIVLDITTKPWVGVRFDYYPKPMGELKLLDSIYALHALYNTNGASCITVFDETSMGGAMIKQGLHGLFPKRGINLAGPSTKRDLLTNLRATFNQLGIELPQDWHVVRRECLNYRVPDDRIRQDAVMCLVGAAAQAAKTSGLVASASFRPSARIAGRRS